MTHRLPATVILVCAVILLLLGTPQAYAGQSQKLAWKDLKVEVELPPAEHFGRYAGDARIALGKVSDRCFVGMPYFIGTVEAVGQ